MPSKRVVGSGALRPAPHGTARRRRQLLKTSSRLLFTGARWTVRQQLTLRRHQAGPKPRLGSLCVLVSGRARARNALWYWSTPTSKSQEFGRNSVGTRRPSASRCERSRHPSLGLPRVGAESDRGRPIFSGPSELVAQKSGQHILLDPSWLHEQAAAGLRCKRLLELLKPSDPVGHLPRPPVARAQSRAPPSSSARHATAAHTSSSTTRLMLGSVAFTLAMSARATPASSAGVGRMAPIVAATPWSVSRATSCWRNSAC